MSLQDWTVSKQDWVPILGLPRWDDGYLDVLITSMSISPVWAVYQGTRRSWLPDHAALCILREHAREWLAQRVGPGMAGWLGLVPRDKSIIDMVIQLAKEQS